MNLKNSLLQAWEKLQIVDIKGKVLPFRLKVKAEGFVLRTTAFYLGSESVRLAYARCKAVAHGLSEDTPIYAESYNMLSQTKGTLKHPVPINPKYTDQGFYHFLSLAGYFTAYNLLYIKGEEKKLVAFSSAHRFSGKVHFNEENIVLEQDLGGILIDPGEEIQLEELFIAEGGKTQQYFENLGNRLAQHHHPYIKTAPPTGWCSWYCFGPKVTQQQVLENMQVMKRDFPMMRYVQIDDGYQRYMGDYLDISGAFEDFDGLIDKIHKAGLEPALWVAPFIAEKESSLFTQHPDYFIKDADGAPLESDRYTYGGWRRGPWYMLDASNPKVCNYLEQLFSQIREKWKIRYFKLDAMVWGAMPFGEHYNLKMSYIEAYRNGMAAIARGAGKDSYLLAANAPMWPSIGTVHGMRVTNDISRKWDRFKTNGEECFCRNWQHRRLWLNDPDCLVLSRTTDALKNEENIFSYHQNTLLASGGAILSGDDLSVLPLEQKKQIAQSLHILPQAAVFDGEDFTVGRQKIEGNLLVTLFNDGDTEKEIHVSLSQTCNIYDYWDNTIFLEKTNQIFCCLQPRSSLAFLCIPL